MDEVDLYGNVIRKRAALGEQLGTLKKNDELIIKHILELKKGK